MTQPDTRAAALVYTLRAGQVLSLDLTARQLAVLALSTLPLAKLRTVRAMAEAIGVSRSCVSRAADTLDRLKLAKRVVDRFDRRVVMLEATALGREAVDRILARGPLATAQTSAALAALRAWTDPDSRETDIIEAMGAPMRDLAEAFGMDGPAPAVTGSRG